MEGTIGEIRMFAGNFAPRSWEFCQGQTITIADNDVLFMIIGTTYGGDGTTTFNLPDLSSRIAVGAGQGPGLSNYILGEAIGNESITLTQAQLSMHNHQAIVQAGSGTFGASANLYGVNDGGGEANPGGNYLGQDTQGGTSSYTSSGTPVPMNAGSIQVNSLYGPSPNVTLQSAGGSIPHTNIQPLLAVNYIICTQGIYPSRN